MRHLAATLTLMFVGHGLLVAQATIRPAEAQQYIGRTATVCGTVVSPRYARGSRGAPTFLNLDEPYPKQVFMVVIWGQHRAKFGTPEVTLNRKRICATGRITSYNGTPEIEASDPRQIQIQTP